MSAVREPREFVYAWGKGRIRVAGEFERDATIAEMEAVPMKLEPDPRIASAAGDVE